MSLIKPANYWNLSNSFIHINNNWTATNITYDWCKGAGTYNDPYVIENITFNGVENRSCILIENTNLYFIIRNVSISNFYSSDPNHAGIKLTLVKKGVIEECNLLYNADRGILLYYSDNNTLRYNNIYYCEKTIDLISSCNNTIRNNKIEYNEFGIGLGSNSDYNLIHNNRICNNDFYGIELLWDCDYNYIFNNYLAYNIPGCFSDLSSNNIYYNNTCIEDDDDNDEREENDKKNKFIDSYEICWLIIFISIPTILYLKRTNFLNRND
ncbi:MAG: right-handed parallel beta-helix repeat-containing protein [Promethearchaeota archaeon]